METPQKIFIVASLARMLSGEYCFLRVDGAYRQASAADAARDQLAGQFRDAQGKPVAVKLTTPDGQADCYCEVGAFAVDLK